MFKIMSETFVELRIEEILLHSFYVNIEKMVLY